MWNLGKESAFPSEQGSALKGSQTNVICWLSLRKPEKNDRQKAGPCYLFRVCYKNVNEMLMNPQNTAKTKKKEE